MPAPSTIGKPMPRKEGRPKVTGAARYIDDMDFPGCLHGVTVRSSAPRGRIRGIRFEPGVPWDEIVVVTAKDIPGENHVALILHDQPFLADEIVNHPEEPVVLLAHADRYLLEEARRRVKIDIDPLPAVLTIDDALAKKHVIWGEDNVIKSYEVLKGDLDAAFRDAHLVVEGTYETGAQEQLYIEPNGMVASASPETGVTIWGSMQCPYYVLKGLLPLFGLPEEKIRIIQAETGGGFGGKEEYPTMIAGHAALLSWKSGKPVKIIYDRAEDMVATTKRHPSRTRHRTALRKDGRILGMDIEFVIDGGAYATLSAVVLSRGTIHAAGPYCIDAVRVRSQAVATNCPPHGAFRGFGAPQSLFAVEKHLDECARRLGLRPEDIRRKNFLREGDTTATGQTIKEKLDLPGLLDRALALSDYHRKRERFSKENHSSSIKRGMGFATFFHGCGFTGSGETYLASKVGVQATREGRVQVLVASTEIGQGTNTILAQIVADALSLDYEMVEAVRPDTRDVPNSGPTVASRTVMVVGKLVESAALGLKQLLVASGLLPGPLPAQPGGEEVLSETYTSAQFAQACASYIEKFGALKSVSQYQAPPGAGWDDKHYRGDAYGTFAWAVYVAEVSVDTVTYEARCEDFVALQEVGRVIHPIMAAGQIEGGVAQAIGFALTEEVVWKDGRMINNQMTNYIMPTAVDLPPIRVFFEENPYAYGPAGAKGIGELPMDGPAPAILNAIDDALGVRGVPGEAGPIGVNTIPALPERLMKAMSLDTPLRGSGCAVVAGGEA